MTMTRSININPEQKADEVWYGETVKRLLCQATVSLYSVKSLILLASITFSYMYQIRGAPVRRNVLCG